MTGHELITTASARVAADDHRVEQTVRADGCRQLVDARQTVPRVDCWIDVDLVQRNQLNHRLIDRYEDTSLWGEVASVGSC
jgi:hypothetical protein